MLYYWISEMIIKFNFVEAQNHFVIMPPRPNPTIFFFGFHLFFNSAIQRLCKAASDTCLNEQPLIDKSREIHINKYI